MDKSLSRPPPPAPPPPPLPSEQHPSKPSFPLKTRETTPAWALGSEISNPLWDPLAAPAGLYFFYGTLQDPQMLREILGLADDADDPVLITAWIRDYGMRLWGQYPAVIDELGDVVKGMAFEVSDERDAARLAAYETRNYGPVACSVNLGEGGEREKVEGYVFKYCGNPDDLKFGRFELERWLNLMGRKPRDAHE